MGSLVTLTTDFGTQDSYVAEIKGVLLSQGPADMRIVDLSHELAAFRIGEAALFLRSAVPRFPEGTLHLVVVDPGVGTSRRPVIARVNGQTLVGPDNGAFGYLLDGSQEVFAIDVDAVAEGGISSTFHGRDIFAPTVARLANGAAPGELGVAVDAYEHLVFPMVEFKGDSLFGKVIHVDRFGNLVTNVPISQLRAFAGDADMSGMRVHVSDRTIDGISDHYGERPVGEVLALVGSSGLLEVAVREDSAARKLRVELGASVQIGR